MFLLSRRHIQIDTFRSLIVQLALAEVACIRGSRLRFGSQVLVYLRQHRRQLLPTSLFAALDIATGEVIGE
ncbi:MAG: hypothetical protein H7039_06225 [Bryobacteraceae bacterium]|nr:hypothetical protein [Bryobacteraceae bacterium]